MDLLNTPIWVPVGALIGVVISAVIQMFPKKGSLEHQMIDQQQERITVLEARLDALEPALVWYQRRDVAWERRESQLMSGVERGEYPPWPARTGILAEEKHD